MGETGWHDSIEWSEGGWLVLGRGRQAGEKKRGGVRVIMREKEGRSVEEIKITREMEGRLGHNKGDMLTVKITEQWNVWWVTVVYMGMESQRNDEDNGKLYEAVTSLKERVGQNKWVVMGDLNGHIGLMEEMVNQNGQLILDFTADMKMRIKKWELEKPVTWRDRRIESALD